VARTRRNYAGVFVHEHTGESETLRVIHRVDGEGVAERLQSMDGSGREFIRRGNQLICYLPDQRTVLVEHSPDAAVLLRGLPRVEAGSASQYDFREVARARVSGRNARVIAIAPLDQMRYGYRVWIDESTAMPLKTQLRDSRGDVLEQIVFTSLNMMSHISRADLEPAVDARGYRWIRRDADPVDARAPSVSWESAAMPPGFRMTASARQMLPVGPVEHLVFSDGLASVSVFVEPYRDEAGSDTHAVREDEVAIGASSAYSVTMRGYRVTAVGEVPADTVRVIAQAIRNPSPAMVSAAPGTFSGPAEAGAATVSGAPQTSAPAFVPGTRTGFDAEEPSPTTLPPPTVPSFRSYGTDRPIFGPPAGPATTAGGGHR
jgi:sigma-E factor negative regulatory protein RseB